MTRVAIIGNSHVGAYVQARKEIKTAFPSLKLSFFALPRHSFSSCVYSDDGILRAREPQENNLPAEIDLARQDHILIVGQRFGIERLARLISSFDVLGLPGLGQDRSVSKPLLRDFLDTQIERFCRQLASFLNDDPRCIAAPMPYLSQAAPVMAGSVSACAQHPAAETLMEMWTDQIRSQMNRLNYGLMLQPAELCANPYRTPAQLTRAYDLTQGAEPTAADFTHMNKEYGLAHFKAYATKWLGLVPQPDTDTLIKEH